MDEEKGLMGEELLDRKILPFLLVLLVLWVKWAGYIIRSDKIATSRWHAKMAEKYLLSGEVEKALSEGEAGLNAEVVYPRIYKLLGQSLYSTGRGREGLKYLERALSFFPTDFELLTWLCNEYFHLKDERALHICERANERGIDKNVASILSALYLKMGDALKAYKVVKRALMLYPRDPDLLFFLALSAMKTGYMDEAERVLNYLLQSSELDNTLKREIEELIHSLKK